MASFTLHQLVHDQVIAPTGHTLALGALLTSWAVTLTPIVSLLMTAAAGLWYLVALWESKTVQDLVKRHAERSAARRARRHHKE